MRNLLPTLMVATIVASGTLLPISASHADPGAYPQTRMEDKLVFSCEIDNNQYTTVPQLVQDKLLVWQMSGTENPSNMVDPGLLLERQVMQEYAPLLAWTVTLDSDHPDGAYTPEGRCHAVSARLTNLASSMGIVSIQELSKIGIVNHEQVVFLSESPVASPDLVIFTLKPDNRDDAPQILNSFQVGVSGAVGGSYAIDAPLPIYE